MPESKTILGYLALFDAAHLCQDGTYWTWRHPSLPLSLLDQFYFEIAAKHWPEDDQDFQNDSLLGGFASVGQQWVCWYRWADGGRDKAARPGRRVLAAVFMLAQDHRGYDASGVIESQVVNTIVEQSLTKCPVPQPVSLELACNVPRCGPCETGIGPPGLKEHVTSTAQRDVSICASIFESLPDGWQLNCSFRQEAATATIQASAKPDGPITEKTAAVAAKLLSSTTDWSRLANCTFSWRGAMIVLLVVAAIALAAVGLLCLLSAGPELLIRDDFHA